MEFAMSLVSIPLWISTYSKDPPGYVHNLSVIMKVQKSRPRYEAYTKVLRSILLVESEVVEYVLSECVSLMLLNVSKNSPALLLPSFSGNADAVLCKSDLNFILLFFSCHSQCSSCD
jgi:hypothetical protein